MMKTVLTLLIGAIALAVTGAFASRSDDAGNASPEMRLEEKIAEIDVNGDGGISGEEYVAFKTAMAEEEWASLMEAAGDDGVISLEEALAHQIAQTGYIEVE